MTLSSLSRTPQSLPALALARAAPDAAPFAPEATPDALLALRAVVTAWNVGASLEHGAILRRYSSFVRSATLPPPKLEEEAQSAANMVRFALDRMHRLSAAYGEWTAFDAGAYFDLTAAQAALLVEVTEQQGAVHVRVYADLLLPRVQKALQSWAEFERLQSAPGSNSAAQSAARSARADALVMRAAARAAHDWLGAVAVVGATRRLLAGEVSYIAANAAHAERHRWQLADGATRTAPPNRSVIQNLFQSSGHEGSSPPTLTLATEFPLPAWRQPGRRRRLIRARAVRLARLQRTRMAMRTQMRREMRKRDPDSGLA